MIVSRSDTTALHGRHIVLVGFSGSGKSETGKELAAALKWPFLDTDKVIARRAGQSITEIFDSKGERYFRRLERELVVDLLMRNRPLVIALGGGAFESADVRRLAMADATVIFLRCSISELARRLGCCGDRPLLRTENQTRSALKERIAGLMRKRMARYLMAHLIVSVTKRTPSATAREIRRQLGI